MDMHVPMQLLEARDAALAQRMTTAFEYRFSDQLSARFDTKQNAMWSRWEAARDRASIQACYATSACITTCFSTPAAP